WTTITAPGKSAGNSGINFISVAGPPVDDATTTMGNFPAPRCPPFSDDGRAAGLAGSAFAGAGCSLVAVFGWELARAAVLTTRTFAAIFSLRQSSSFTELISKSIPDDGFATKSIAPSCSALSVTSAPSRDSELTITTGCGLL